MNENPYQFQNASQAAFALLTELLAIEWPKDEHAENQRRRLLCQEAERILGISDKREQVARENMLKNIADAIKNGRGT